MGRAVVRGAGLLLGAALMTGCGGAPDEAGDVSVEKTDAQGEALTDTYTKTKYPIVLCHGMAGFDSLFGVMDYFNGIQEALTSGGARVYITHVPPFNSTEERGEALLEQVEDIIAVSGASKVNLIGHSHGGLDVRYVAATRPELVASVTSVGSPHQGAELADYLRDNIKEGGFTEGVVGFFANSLGTVLGLLSGHTSPQDSVSALESLSSAGMDAFNAQYPAGLPSAWCGNGPATANGIRYYSWSGTSVLTNVLDVSDGPMGLTWLFYEEANDGLVGRCSSHLGTVIRDDYKMNHLDEVNQLFGFTALFSTSPKTVFRAHANRLKSAGL
jgi:triacylglycerol lipase